jgi:hypothetical protein
MAKSGTLENGMAAADATGALAAKAIYGTSGSTGSPSGTHSVATYSVEIPSEGTWYAWGRFNFENTNANSFWIQIDSQSAIRFGNTATYGSWLWDGSGSGSAVSLGAVSAGQHTLKVYAREPGAACLLDFICLTKDGSYTPTDGDASASMTTRINRREMHAGSLSRAPVAARVTAAGDLQVNLGFAGEYAIDLYSPDGKLVAHAAGNAPAVKTFDAHQLGANMYLVNINSGAGNYSKILFLHK